MLLPDLSHRGEVLTPGVRTYAPRMRTIETIDSELSLAALRRAARERGGPSPSASGCGSRRVGRLSG
jgi:hypothetical protein